MLLTGFCNVQNKEYEIDVQTIPTTAMEDNSCSFIAGRITCMYAAYGKCDGSECSILKQHNIKR